MYRFVRFAMVCVFLIGTSAAVGQAAPDPTLPVVPENCDYIDAVLHDGWGWNESTGESCEPIPGLSIDFYVSLYEATEVDATYDEIIGLLRVDYCDYSEANSHNGYGWNNVLLESCPPVEVPGEPSNQPVVVGELPLVFEQYPLHTIVDSNGTIFSFRPPTNSLAAMTADGMTLWSEPLPRSLFVNDIKLTQREDMLIISSLGGMHAAFYTDGTMKWLVDVEGATAPPAIDLTDNGVIVHYQPDENSNLQSFIAFYDYEGVQKWKYESALEINEFSMGRDGLIYVLTTVPDTGNKRYVILQP